jgi:hypothetical protein
MKIDAILLFTGITSFVFGVQSVLAQGGEEALRWNLQQNLDDLPAIQKKVDGYLPNTRSWLAGEFDDPWLRRAISMREREKWAKHEKMSPEHNKLFDPAFNSLAASIAKKMPLHKPLPGYFTFHNPAEEEIIKAYLNNIGRLKIHKIGFPDDEWQQTGTTNPPYKKAYVWAKDTSDDHAYCHLFVFKLAQQYQGGGQYGGAPDCALQEDILVGCP